MSDTPLQIVQCLDQLELYSDDPVKVMRLTVELRERLHTFAVDVLDDRQMLEEKVDDLTRQLTAIVNMP